jgi:tetratricopeptide (TPR) repeat protein
MPWRARFFHPCFPSPNGIVRAQRTGLPLIFALLGLAFLSEGQDARILEVENRVEAVVGGATSWAPASVNQSLALGDRVRTGARSRASVRLTSLYTMRMEQLTTIVIAPPPRQDARPELELSTGAAFIFSRETGGEIDVKTPTANGALRGTQLFVSVGPDGRSFFQTFEGSVEVSNDSGSVTIRQGEAAEAIPGQAPKVTAVLEAENILQWALYYPAVIDVRELSQGAGPPPAPIELPGAGADQVPWENPPPPASSAIGAYQQGDLLHAVSLLPTVDSGADGRCLQAAILLSVGRVDEAERLLRGVSSSHPARLSIERVIAAVKFEEQPEWLLTELETASEALAESFYRQSRSQLEPARDAARRATELSPDNGHAWVRLAELEFSFGRTRQARAALERGLRLAPRNAQGHALLGFVLSAENRIEEASRSFERATRLDGALGNGWLGLGLSKIRRGDLAEGRGDLQTAATVEPLRSAFHSYLGKAFSLENRRDDARRDIDLAKQLDPDDPTPWLYSAIERQQHNETNAAIAEMQQSIRLNDNRRVYRSGFLLDQDRAVRGANLARIYQNAGMNEVAMREASRAVQSDYTNASAHLFLANAFNAQRDPKRISLRSETPWFNELLLANLLSPVGGGPLSQYVSNQEYSKLLEFDGIGGSIATEWRDTDEVRSVASVFGTSGKVSFGLDYGWRDAPGMDVRFNDAAELDEIYGQIKWQATPDDTLYFLSKWAQEEHGDIFDTYDNQPREPFVSFQEDQEPGLLLGGWNHRWGPGSHTLLLGGRLAATQWLTNPQAPQYLFQRDNSGLRPGFLSDSGGSPAFTNPALAGGIRELPDGSLEYSPTLLTAIAPYLGSGELLGAGTANFDFATRREIEIDSLELQHIQEWEEHTLLGGVRLQSGEVETTATLAVERPTPLGGFSTPAADQRVVGEFERQTFYAYDFWSPKPWLTLIGGASWDHIEHPDNFRNPPVNDLQREDERLSGKAGLILSPTDSLHLRGVYTQGLGGMTFDESVRLEPVQIAGFNQSYRTLLSESIAGSVETPRFQTWGLGLDGNLSGKTWWGITGQVAEQRVDRTLGAFDGISNLPGDHTYFYAYFPSSIAQELSYLEESLLVTINQLIDRDWAVGTTYRVTDSSLRTTFPEIPASVDPDANLLDSATLHELGLSLNWNSPSGFFARIEENFYAQDLDDDPAGRSADAPSRENDAFWQTNLLAGYRFNRNLCEVSAGLLNVTDQDYRLGPLNPYFDIARERTLIVRFRASF